MGGRSGLAHFLVHLHAAKQVKAYAYAQQNPEETQWRNIWNVTRGVPVIPLPTRPDNMGGDTSFYLDLGFHLDRNGWYHGYVHINHVIYRLDC